MARRAYGGDGGGGAGGGMMAPILSIATGLIIFVVLIVFAPTIAGSIERAQTGTPCRAVGLATGPLIPPVGPGNETTSWNRTCNPTMIDPVTVWSANIQILGVVILIISIAVALYYLKGMG